MFDTRIEGAANIEVLGKTLPDARQRIREFLSSAMKDFANRSTSTIKKDFLSGAGDTLKVKTGRLRSSIRYLLAEGRDEISLTVGSDVPYAAIHEFGGQTAPHTIEPRRKKVLRFLVGGSPIFARAVKHPGSTIRARPFLKPGVEAEIPWLRERIDDLLMRASSEGLGG